MGEWFAPETPIRGPENGPMERTAKSCVSAALAPIYSVLQFRESADAQVRWVANIGGVSRGIGPCVTRLLDLQTGEEFETTDTDEHARARRIRAIDLPDEIQAIWPRHPKSGLLRRAGYDSGSGNVEVDLDELRTIANADTSPVQASLFG